MAEEKHRIELEHLAKYRQLYSIAMEKDVRIEELESRIEDYEATLKDVSETKHDQDNYTLITINNAMRTNLKQKDKEIKSLKYR